MRGGQLVSDKGTFDIYNFHFLLSRLCRDIGMLGLYKNIWADYFTDEKNKKSEEPDEKFLAQTLPSLILEILKNNKEKIVYLAMMQS